VDKQDKSRAHFRCCPAEKHRTATPSGLFALRPKQGFSEIFYAQEQSYFGTAILKFALFTPYFNRFFTPKNIYQKGACIFWKKNK